MKHVLIDITGQSFGRLTVVERHGSNGSKQATWTCLCSCGSEAIVIGNKLRSGHTKSCGCLLTETLLVRNTTHNKYHTPERRVWAGMISRCHNENEPCYPRYGGRGIRVCDEWRKDFEAFLAHIGPRPSSAHSIDRIKNERGYEPGNVRWATRKQQSRNRDCVPFYEFAGRRAQLPEFAEIYNLPVDEIRRRLWRGWSLERTLTQPLRRSPIARAVA